MAKQWSGRLGPNAPHVEEGRRRGVADSKRRSAALARAFLVLGRMQDPNSANAGCIGAAPRFLFGGRDAHCASLMHMITLE